MKNIQPVIKFLSIINKKRFIIKFNSISQSEFNILNSFHLKRKEGTMFKNFLLLSILLLFSIDNTFGQSGSFNIDEYKTFLNTHKDLTASQLLDMHPAGAFRDKVNFDAANAFYLDSISNKYNLTDYEKSLIADNGFMVSERLSKSSFGEAFLEIYNSDLPVFVSADAILHAFHISYDRILREVELGILINRVEEILNQLYNGMSQLHNTYSSNPEMLQMLKDVDVYISVPRKLFDESSVPYYSENSTVVDEIINEIMNEEGYKTYTLFSENCRVMDWSQFKPRGHYDDPQHTELQKYFRVMIWLGRIEMYLLAPDSFSYDCNKQTFNDIKRQTIDVFLFNELFELSGVQPVYDEVENIIQFFAGNSDNVTIKNVQYLKNAVSINSASELLDSIKVLEFQDTLKNQSFAYQLILSQILTSDPFTPDTIVPASAFMLFGQRFVVDSYVTGSVVYDRISYNGGKVCRLFPSTLDVLYSLGNDASAQLLVSELNAYHYSSNLSALRYDPEFWKSTLYNSWLGLLRSLNPRPGLSGLPGFMKTAAYWQEKMNTQLSSWAQLRHDNLLYAKQSYTGGTLCSYPYSYVEPFPELYLNLKTIGGIGYDKFQNINFPNPWYGENILQYFSYLGNVSDTLLSITQKELNGTPFNPDEANFLKRMIYNRTEGSGTPPYDGWYAKLFYNDYVYQQDGLLKNNHIVADIHTVPTDCSGIVTGWIPHVGTGPVNLSVWAAEYPSGQLTAYVGPVLSYYEYTTTNFQRLTDSEWDETYLSQSIRPNWVNIYLADSSGSSKGEGLKLITSVNDNKKNPIPETHLLARNYPNPFNPSTIISFSIPYDLTNSKTELVIYNIQGEVVKRLVDETLPSGNYLTRWDGTNELGIQVTSGIYIYSLRVADKQVSGKMTLIK